MQNLVIIKSSKYGLTVRLDQSAPYEILLEEIKRKFTESAKFFDGAKMTISFEGRVLTKTQEQEIIDAISEIANIHISCIIEHDERTEKIYKSIVDETLKAPLNQDGQFYRGTLKSHQVLESETSIVMLGDIDVGATVVAKGNVVVIGTIKGTVHAGVSGRQDAFIAALSIQTRKLKIGSQERRHIVFTKANQPFSIPRIAQLDGCHVFVDPLID